MNSKAQDRPDHERGKSCQQRKKDRKDEVFKEVAPPQMWHSRLIPESNQVSRVQTALHQVQIGVQATTSYNRNAAFIFEILRQQAH
jgi:hypothetical protein